MNRDQYTDEDYGQPHVPPTTAPTIDPKAEPLEAAELARDDGDSDSPGSSEASADRGDEDADIAPGNTPDEIEPLPGDRDMPAKNPVETPLPPD